MTRRLTLTPELSEAIARDVRAGMTIGEAARAHRISRATLYAWMGAGAVEVEHDLPRTVLGEFCAAVRQARAQFARALLDKVTRFTSASRPTREMERDAIAARRTLERRFPEYWGKPRARGRVVVNVEIPQGSRPQSIRIEVP